MSTLAKAGLEALRNPKLDAYLEKQLSLLESIPNFSMKEFTANSAYSRLISLEVLQILVNYGLDLNY